MDLTQLLQRAEQGFAPIPLSNEQKTTALRHLEHWLTSENFETYRPQVLALFEREDWSTLLDSFYRVIPFGTGGRRGRVGIGPNRINPYTIGTSVQGHIAYLKQLFPEEASMRVVIAYDVRCFQDLKKTFDPDQPNPLVGLSSKNFAQQAAQIYAANGVESYILPTDAESYLSTPELSYLIRAYEAQGGLNVSASHNHPDDNGGKFYNEHGGQPIPPNDEQMSALVEEVEEVHSIAFDEGVERGLIRWIDAAHRQGYIDVNRRQQLQPDLGSKAIVAFSPMHGTGLTSVAALLEESGYTVHLLESQSNFDGNFPNVRYRMPNPEVRESMKDVIAWGKESESDLVMATDPDADRIGLAAPDQRGEWRFFTGNEIAALLTQYKLETLSQQQKLPSNPLVLKTEVTTSLISRITEAYEGTCVGGLLVGFKYIGDGLHQWESTGKYLGVEGNLNRFILGTEESHGILVTHEVRDKDAAGAALLLAEYASVLKAQGKTLVDAIEALYQRFGYFHNQLTSLVMEGAIGLSNIRGMQASLREDPPTQIGKFKVVEQFDHWDTTGRFGEIRSDTDRSSRNMLVFHLENDMRLVLRPSGTEPKAKIYVEVPSPPASDRESLRQHTKRCSEIGQQLSDAFVQTALQRLDIDLPAYALRFSDLIAVDQKERIANQIFPRLLERASATAQNELEAWFTESLTAINPNPKVLLETGFALFLEQATVDDASKQAAQSAFNALP